MSSFGPILKVMRIQRPSLASCYSTCTNYHTLIPNSISNVLLLPDTFGNIHEGETFAACLSVTNVISNAVESTAPAYNSADSVPLPLPTFSNVTNLTINAYLQTPTQRHRLDNPMDSSNKSDGCTLPLCAHVDVVVSRRLDEIGQHILRVEISYNVEGESNPEGNLPNPNITPSSRLKVIRKFYRFQVSQPLHIRHSVCRQGDAACFVSVDIENILQSSSESASNSTGELNVPSTAGNHVNIIPPPTTPFLSCDNSPDLALSFTSVLFKPADGFSAETIVPTHSFLKNSDTEVEEQNVTKQPDSSIMNKFRRSFQPTAVQLYDSMVRLRPRESHRYLFKIQAASENATIRGIAFEDVLGHVEIHWRRSLGEGGCIRSPLIYTPHSIPPSILNRLGTLHSYIRDVSKINGAIAMDEIDSGFVVYGSGLSVDTAAASVTISNTHNKSLSHSPSSFRLQDILPVTVEPIDPPTDMVLGCTYPVELLIVNHGNTALHVHLQMRLSFMKGVVVSGPSFVNLGEIPPNGGSTATMIRLLALLPGLFQVRGCFIVEPMNGREIAQPPLFSIYIHDEDEEKE